MERHLVHTRHDNMGGIDVGADHCDLMVIAGVGQAGVTAPTIRVDGASGLHGGAHKGQQAVSRHIPNAAQPDPGRSRDRSSRWRSR